MILDTMTYSVMTVVAVWIFIVILLAWYSQGRQNNSNK
jgi:hypothetical protein